MVSVSNNPRGSVDSDSVPNANDSELSIGAQFVGPGGIPRVDALEILGKVLDLGLKHKYRSEFTNGGSKTGAEVVSEPMPLEGVDLETLLRTLEEDYLPGMPNFGSPMFQGFPDAGNSAAGMAGALLADCLNVNLINSTFCSGLATQMEIAVIRWLRELVGFDPAGESPGGAALPGGTTSNMMATLLARGRALPESSTAGIKEDLKVVVPEAIGHYSIRASMGWTGLGENNFVAAPINGFRYDLEKLDSLLGSLKDNNVSVAMGVAYAGDSRTQTIDNLTEVARVFRRHYPDIWMHCDGCHGTSLLFSESHKRRLNGLSTYDSVTLDPHKVLAVPYPCSFLLVRDAKDMSLIETASDLIMRQEQSLGRSTPGLGSKSFFSLRLWMLFKSLGLRGIGEMVNDRIVKARTFAGLIDQHPLFIRLNETDINSVAFVFKPSGMELPLSAPQLDRLSKINLEIYNQMLAEGDFYVHSFSLPDSLSALSKRAEAETNVLRVMSGNPLTTLDHMNQTLSMLAEIGKECEVR